MNETIVFFFFVGRRITSIRITFNVTLLIAAYIRISFKEIVCVVVECVCGRCISIVENTIERIDCVIVIIDVRDGSIVNIDIDVDISSIGVRIVGVNIGVCVDIDICMIGIDIGISIDIDIGTGIGVIIIHVGIIAILVANVGINFNVGIIRKNIGYIDRCIV